MSNPMILWSKFGLYREITRDEIAAGTICTMSLADVDASLAANGYALTYCDVEPVAILLEYPTDAEPEAVLKWLADEEEKRQLGAEYKELVGYDPFEDDPSNTIEGVRKIIREYREIVAAGGLDGDDA
jgi:hypothetical protein